VKCRVQEAEGMRRSRGEGKAAGGIDDRGQICWRGWQTMHEDHDAAGNGPRVGGRIKPERPPPAAFVSVRPMPTSSRANSGSSSLINVSVRSLGSWLRDQVIRRQYPGDKVHAGLICRARMEKEYFRTQTRRARPQPDSELRDQRASQVASSGHVQ
jgi:hypothetical protein